MDMNQMNGGAPTQGAVPQQTGMPIPNYTAPQPAAQPAQPAQPQRQMSAQERMRMQRGNVANASATPTMMSQGNTYQPESNAQPVQQQQPVQQTPPPQQSPVANRTLINTNPVSTVPQDDLVNDGAGTARPDKKPLNKLAVVGGVVVGILVLIVIVTMMSKGGGEGTEEVPSSDSTFEDPMYNPDIEWEIPDVVWSYTPDELAQLRAAGYTGDEIEQHAANQVPAADLIKDAEVAREAYIQEAMAPLFDTASDEYKDYISQTWLALPESKVINEWQETAGYYVVRENLDYEKIDVHGSQLFIKIYLDDNEHENWFFCLVTPDEWNKLDDAGNIIVNYKYVTRYKIDDVGNKVEGGRSYIVSSSIEFVE